MRKSSATKLLFAVISLFFSIFVSQSANATLKSDSSLYKLSLLQGVQKCYRLYAKSSIKLGEFSDYSSIFEGGWTSDGDVVVTTEVGNTLSDSDLSCKQVFSGWNGPGGGRSTGLASMATIPNTLDKLGYSFSSVEGAANSSSGTANANSDQLTITVPEVSDSSGENGRSTNIRGSIVCDGEQKFKNRWIRSDYYYWDVTNCSGSITITSSSNNLLFSITATGGTNFIVNSDVATLPYDSDHFSMHISLLDTSTSRLSFGDAFKNSDFAKFLKADIETAASYSYNSPKVRVNYKITTPSSTTADNTNSVYKPTDNKYTAASIMLNNLGVDNSLSHSVSNATSGQKVVSYYWNAPEKYSLYYKYLQNMMKKYPTINIENCGTDKPNQTYVFKNSASQWCGINIDTEAQGIKSETVAVSRTKTALTKGTFEEVLAWFGKESSYSGMSDDDYANATISENGELDPNSAAAAEDSGEEADQTCANSGGAISLGWILCPLLEWMGDAAEKAYDDYVEPLLSISPQLFNTGDESSKTGTLGGWSTFRTIANTIFIIVLLVVIFSQLTGVGIDNYGIKKILPKLIVAAVLINLSYVVCMICVDLSNIIGNGLQAMFNGLADQATTLPEIIGSSASKSSFTPTAISGVAIAAVLVGMVGAIWANPAIILSLLVGVLGIVVAIFFLFILLAAREAAIIVLIVISPLAVVMYMLPNTKKYFDKYIKFFSGLLLVYPICGLLVGGGNYVSNLLLSSGMAMDGFTQALTAMVIGIVPIFFIPTVLKGSFAAMGNLGAKISSFGQRLGGSAQRGIRNSGVYKNAQQSGLERQTRIRAGLKLNKDGTVSEATGARKALGTLMSGGKRSRQRNALAYQKMVAERGSLEAVDGADFMLATETANEMKQLVASGDINNTSKLGTGLEEALMTNNRAKIRAYTDALSAKGEDGREAVKASYNRAVNNGASAAAKKAWADNVMANHAMEYKNNDRSTFEVAKAINRGDNEGTTTGAYLAGGGQATLAGKVTAGNIGTMDDNAFNEVFGGYNGSTAGFPNGVDDGMKTQIGAAAYAALNDQNANIKTERRAALEQLVADSGYTPPTQNVNIAGAASGGTPTTGTSTGAGGTPAPADSGGGRTITMQGASGEVTFSRQADGTWTDQSGNVMEGNFDARVQEIEQRRHNEATKQRILNDRANRQNQNPNQNPS